MSEEFNLAAQQIKTLTTNPTNEELLQLYGLYKRVTEGLPHVKKPSLFDYKSLQKWKSWDSYKAHSRRNCERMYIELVGQLFEKYK